ncbi:response regulator [Magnetospirillum sp. SS-4]|uniref:response regulator n=1 Tax=Magnetospirillum sp. SS-4 TaxID=2681465 RepID=UPI00138560B1|nr:response regulator [Magnetospirillum sp. SS-4]CAA7616564.1 CheY-like receiver [Magnetospirillum sp. SS-4]
MSDPGSNHHGKAAQEVVEQLRLEFIDELTETLQSLDMAFDAARNGHRDLRGVITDCRRAAVLLRGQAANFTMHRLATVAHRLDEYLTNAPEIAPPRLWDDVIGYFDLMTRLAQGREDIERERDPATLVRGLPAKLGFDLGDIEIRNVEVLLVMPPGAQTRFVERELQQCGYRVSMMPDSLHAFAMVVQTKPDLVIISAVMPELEGIDLAMALSAMPSTRNIPLAVITSLDKDDESLKLLPKRVPVLFKGASFADDLFKALDNLFLI